MYHHTYATRIVDHFQVAAMQPRYPVTPHVRSRAVVGVPQGYAASRTMFGPGGVRGLGATMDATANPPDGATPTASSDDLTGTALIRVVGGAIVGAAAGAFAAHDWRASGPGALGVAGLVTLFEAGRALTQDKGTLGIGMGLAAALMIGGGWILAKDQRGRARGY